MIPWLYHPCKGMPLTQKFGENPSWYPNTNGHNGIDWGGTPDTVIHAAYDGVVISARDGGRDGYGLHVFQSLPDGGLLIYGHLSMLNVIDLQAVKAGDPIGMMGNTGWSDGTHLHFEYRPGGANSPAVDPMGLIIDFVPDEQPLCVALCVSGGVAVRTGRKVERGIIRRVQEGCTEPVFDFYPGGWMRLSDGYCLIGDDGGKWWRFVCAKPAEKPKELLVKRQGRFKAE